MKLYPCNYLSRESGLYKASDVCEKSDAVKRLSMTIIYLTDELQLERNNQHKCIFNHSIVVQSNLLNVAVNLLHSQSDLIVTYSRAFLIWAVWDQ